MTRYDVRHHSLLGTLNPPLRMIEHQFPITFEAVEMKDGSGWFVQVTLPRRNTRQVTGVDFR
jgi:hypothetical protein